jgi:uncharacterized protein YndB with AHSA1/START domain
MKTIDLTLTRTIPASPAEAFDGWLDATCPGTVWNVAVELILEPKVDALYYWLSLHDGERKPHYGRFIVVDRPRKLQYTWMSPHTRGLESLVTVTFARKGGDTLLTLRHENLPDEEHGRGHEPGWGQLLTRFAERFSAPG